LDRTRPPDRPKSRPEFRRWAAALLDQQLWCWGRDITRPGGNVLLDLGMCCHRAPGPGRATSQYTAAVAGGATVCLWGFGLLYAEPGRGGVFLRRYEFDPRLVPGPPPVPVHQPERIGPAPRPASAGQWATTRLLLRAAAGWVARYEHWVAERFGSAYREAVLRARPRPPAVPAREMAAAWERLAKKAARLGPAAPVTRGPWAGVFAALCPNGIAFPPCPNRPTPARPPGRAFGTIR